MNGKTAFLIGWIAACAIAASVAEANQGRLRLDATPASGQGGTTDCSGTYVADCGLESGAPGVSGWASTSTNFSSVFCSSANCGNAGGPMVPHSGNWFAWFGGTSGAETGTLSQNVTLPSGTAATLSFWYASGSTGCVAGTQADFIEARIDGTALWHMDAADATYCNGSYAQISIAIPAQYLGGTHVLAFYAEKPSGAQSVNFAIDDVDIQVTTPVSLQSFRID